MFSMPRMVFGPGDRDRYTLRQVAELGLAIVFECRNCRKASRADMLELIGRYGTDTTLGELRRKARCNRCRKREADVLMRQAEGRKDLDWWPRPPGASR
ncbi:MAG: hypothetical protein C3F17_09860 [Bradyrhizobiaceae bacterium]|nr:MAG: hypothetical protein C3F17_09860 [Bradyrhizobiaceae bacterium]